jgi:hypothetical protein
MLTPQVGFGLRTPQPCKQLVTLQAELDNEVDDISAQFRRQGQPTVTRLSDSLFVGGYPSDHDLVGLYGENVRTVVTVCGGSDRIRSIPACCPGMEVLTLNTVDASDYFILVADFDDFASIVDKALLQGGVYVHCVAGVNRSVTLVAAYLISRHEHTPLSAVRLFRECGRPVILDNRSFRRQLVEFFLETTNAPRRTITAC